MPTLRRLCNWPACGDVALPGRDRCADHAKKREAYRRSSKDDNRPSASARGYDVKWRRIRAMYLRRHPECAECGRPAEEVDHITPLARGGTHQWENLQALCKSCHSKKTISENRGEGGKIASRAS